MKPDPKDFLRAGVFLVIAAVFFAFYPVPAVLNAEEKYKVVHSTSSASPGIKEEYEVIPSTGPNSFGIEEDTGISSSTILTGVPIKLHSDYARYIREEDRLFASGNVEVEFEGTVIKCDEIDIKIQAKEIDARGNCSIKDSYIEIYGDSITYNYDTKDGTVINANCKVEEWYLRGPRMEKKGDGKFILYKGYASSCELFPAHYRLSAYKITIIPDRWIIFSWVSLMVGNIPLLPPILPFPKLVIPLRKERLGIKGNNYEIGYGGGRGLFVMAWLPFTIFKIIDGEFNVNWSTRKQWEYGMKLDNEYSTEHIKGNFLVKNDNYRTEDRLESNWKVYGEHNQDFPGLPGLKLQAKINYMNKNDVNRKQDLLKGEELARDDMERITSNITSNMALSYTKSNYNIRMVAERKDEWNKDESKFAQDSGQLPFVNFNLNKIKLFSVSKLPIYFNAGASFKNSYNKDMNDLYKMSASDNASLSTSFNINKINTFGMNMKYNQNWDEVVNELSDSFNGGFTWQSDLRMVCLLPVKMNYAFSWDFRENKSSANSLNFRVESLRGKTRKKGQLEAVITTGLTLPVIEDEIRIPPLQGMYDYFVENLKYVNLRMDYHTDKSKFYLNYISDICDKNSGLWELVSVDTEFNYKPFGDKWNDIDKKKGLYWTNRIKYLGSDPSRIDIVNDFGFWFMEKWRLNFNTRLHLFTDGIRASEFTEHTISIYKQLHCWEMNINWEKRASKEELWVRFNVKIIPESFIGVSGKKYRDPITDELGTQWELILE